MVRSTLFLLLLVACAHVPVESPERRAWAEASAEVEPCQKLLVERRVQEGHDCARAMAQSKAPLVVHLAEDLQITASVLSGDFDAAQRVVDVRSARSFAANDPEQVAWDLNMTTWLRWSRGAVEDALATNTQMLQFVDGAALGADEKRELLLHTWWDRAYLLVELNRLADAEAARRSYRSLARQPDEHDGLLVLDSFFSLKAGEFEAARATALQVDPARDADAQDLFVLWLALHSAGDQPAADRVRSALDGLKPYPMLAMVMRALGEPGPTP
jgi:hypothetical protein